MALEPHMSAVELLGAGINALAHADAAQLEGLAEAAQGVLWPGTPEEQMAAREGLRTLEYLMTLTRRNLRLLRGAGGLHRPGTEVELRRTVARRERRPGEPRG
jgi:hypothetical protein